MKRILIVDDSPTALRVVSRALSGEYEITTAENGLVGWLKATAEPRPDLIIADVEMPKLNGISMIKRLRTTPGCAELPVIFLSSRDRPEDVAFGLKTGAQYYLSKPFTADELRAKVHHILPP